MNSKRLAVALRPFDPANDEPAPLDIGVLAPRESPEWDAEPRSGPRTLHVRTGREESSDIMVNLLRKDVFVPRKGLSVSLTIWASNMVGPIRRGAVSSLSKGVVPDLSILVLQTSIVQKPVGKKALHRNSNAVGTSMGKFKCFRQAEDLEES